MEHRPDRPNTVLDDESADRLLSGLATDDAPQGYEKVAAALQAAAQLATAAPTQGSDTAVSAFLDAIPSRRTSRMKKWQIAAATLAGGLALSTGLAAADVLPGGAQDVASTALSHVGIHVPGNDDDGTTVSTVEAEKESKKDDVNENSPTSTTLKEHPDNHGADVSATAHDDSVEGRAHGAAVSNVASNGKSQAGATHGKSGEDHPAATTQGGAASTSGSSSNTGSGSANSGAGSTNSGASSNAGSSSSSNSNSSSSGGSSSSSVSSGSSGG